MLLPLATAPMLLDMPAVVDEAAMPAMVEEEAISAMVDEAAIVEEAAMSLVLEGLEEEAVLVFVKAGTFVSVTMLPSGDATEEPEDGALMYPDPSGGGV